MSLLLSKTNYCSVCGSPLVKTSKLYKYSEYDGTKVFHTIVTCSKNRWFNKHFYEIFNEYGNRVSEYLVS